MFSINAAHYRFASETTEAVLQFREPNDIWPLLLLGSARFAVVCRCGVSRRSLDVERFMVKMASFVP
jgi:hypothetical protein